MPLLSVRALWDAHPGRSVFPCDSALFSNQCAIRMSVALRGAGMDLGSFRGAVCYPNLNHRPRHVLRAQELANWLVAQAGQVGPVRKHTTRVTHADFADRRGIVFIHDGWGPTDHIDVWDGSIMKGGDPDYFARGRAVWFWSLAP